MSCFRIVVIGDPKAGKSQYLRRITNANQQPETYQPTIGANTFLVEDQEHDIVMIFCDIGGNTLFNKNNHMSVGYFIGAHMVICVGNDPAAIEADYRRRCFEANMWQEAAVPAIHFSCHTIPDDLPTRVAIALTA